MKKSTLFALLLLSAPTFAQSSGSEIEEVSVKRELASYQVIVSPNPSVDDVYINAPEGSICRIVSASGTYVGTWEVRENGIDLNDLGMGTYIAVITMKGQSIRRRFVIL
ncbi:MAG: T9SS type A sorting domain-containing protein [Crocinitomicaceae bacterium]|nr:T9SS type A sorting domain-containing protein [Flavobacteriales bacterium]NQZ36588.1 T9SS type A sorting domain-containing protein [Crocinitomicaceae bacterium]